MARKQTRQSSGTRRTKTGGRNTKSATARKKTGAVKKTARKKTAVRKRRTKPAAKKTRTAGGARKKATAKRPAATVASRRKTAARAAATRARRAAPAAKPPGRMQAAATAVTGVISGAVTAIVDRLPWTGEPDAIQILEREHRRFEELLRQGEETTERARVGRRDLLGTLTMELTRHELMEEKVLYPALQSHPDAREVVLEGFQEHHVADLIVAELHGVATDDEAWGAKWKVLKENIEHHIQEEEREMFPVARRAFSRDELRDLAERMQEVARRAIR